MRSRAKLRQERRLALFEMFHAATCHKYVVPSRHRMVLVLPDRELWLLRHNGHGEHVQVRRGYSKSVWCPVTHALYDSAEITFPVARGDGFIREWYGKWTKANDSELGDELVKYVASLKRSVPSTRRHK